MAIQTKQIRIAEIYVPTNHRVGKANEQEIKSIAASMETLGQLEPIRVRTFFKNAKIKGAKASHKYVLCFGHRRLSAGNLNKNKTIRAEVHPPAHALTIYAEKTAENLEQKHLSIIEQADAVDQMLKASASGQPIAGKDYKKVSELLGRTLGWVNDRAYMVLICSDVRSLAHAGLLKAGHLRELAKVGDDYQQTVAALMALKVPGAFDGMDIKVIPDSVSGVVSDVNDGRLNVISIEDIKKSVEALKRSLARVPWLLDKPVGGRRSCVGCKSNTSTDTSLFGETEACGSCMNSVCYLSKQDQAEKAKKRTIDILIKGKKQPTAENVQAHTPEWYKLKTIVNQCRSAINPVKKQVESHGGDKKKNGKSISDTLLEPRATKVRSWKQLYSDAIQKYRVDVALFADELMRASGTISKVTVLQFIGSVLRAKKLTPNVWQLIAAAATPAIDPDAKKIEAAIALEFDPGMVDLFFDCPSFVLRHWCEAVAKRLNKAKPKKLWKVPAEPVERDFKPKRKKRTKNIKKVATKKAAADPQQKKPVLKKKNSKRNKAKTSKAKK